MAPKQGQETIELKKKQHNSCDQEALNLTKELLKEIDNIEPDHDQRQLAIEVNT